MLPIRQGISQSCSTIVPLLADSLLHEQHRRSIARAYKTQEFFCTQARRRGTHRLGFLNANLGTWEQFELVGDGPSAEQPWSRAPVALRSRRLPQVPSRTQYVLQEALETDACCLSCTQIVKHKACSYE